MKNAKRALTCVLAIVLLLTAAAFAGVAGSQLPDIGFVFTAEAAKQGDFEYSVLDGKATITKYTGSATELVIPSELGGYPVTSIGEDAFNGCPSLTSVTIPDSVTYIGNYAFYGCKKLTSVTIPDSVTYIGGSAFKNCTSLTSVTIGDSVTSIGDFAFCDCTNLTSVTIGDSVTSIGDFAFFRCNLLTSVTIPDGVKSIGDYAFYDCSSLTSITIPDSVTSIGEHAFYGCSSLTSITIPDSVTSIGGSAFYDCSSLTSITIPDSVTSIGEYAFEYCTSLFEISVLNPACSIPDASSTFDSSAIIRGYDNSTAQSYAEKHNRFFISLSGNDNDVLLSGYAGENADFSISRDGTMRITGTGALYDYSYDERPWTEYARFIKSVQIAEGITSIGSSFAYNFQQLPSVTIPDSVTSIGDYAFDGCSSLTSVTIPDSVTSIGWGAFYFCTSLTSVTIPDSVTSIGRYAFSGCSSLTSITIPDSVTSIGNYAFYGCSSLTSVIILNASCTIYNSKDTIPQNATIYGYDNSTAKAYARKYGNAFELFVCTHEKTTALPAVSPTCTASGLTAGVKCLVCGETVTAQQTVSALGHDYKAAVTAPTLTSKGYTTYTCKNCGVSEKKDYVDPIAIKNTIVKGNALIGLADTTAATLLSQAGTGAKLTKADGTAKKADEKIGTGDKLVLPDGTEMTLSVLGDINGDGEIATSDARLALRKAVNLETFTEAQDTAACVDGGAVVEVAHARKILRASVNLEKAEDWFKAMAK